MAEKEGFEPSIPFWGIHDFQSCALDQLRDFSMKSTDFGRVEIILLIIHDIKKIVKRKTKIFLGGRKWPAAPCTAAKNVVHFPQ